MGHRIALALLTSLLYPLSAQVPLACAAQLVPLKPIGIACSNAAPVCMTDSAGINGKWVWGCPATADPATQLDSTIPLRVTQPKQKTYTELLKDAEELRRLRLENQRIEQEIRSRQAALEATYGPISYLGANFRDIDAKSAKKLRLSGGIKIMSVTKNSPASAGGLKRDDLLTKYDGQDVIGSEQFSRFIQDTPVGKVVALDVYRKGIAQGVTITIGKKPW